MKSGVMNDPVEKYIFTLVITRTFYNKNFLFVWLIFLSKITEPQN